MVGEMWVIILHFDVFHSKKLDVRIYMTIATHYKTYFNLKINMLTFSIYILSNSNKGRSSTTGCITHRC